MQSYARPGAKSPNKVPTGVLAAFWGTLMPWAYSDAIVYAIRCSGGVKLGITTQLSERVAAVRMHNPLPLTIEREVWLPWHRARWMERALHERFAGVWIHGEWFSADTPSVRSAFTEITPLAACVPMPDKTAAQASAVESEARNRMARQLRAAKRVRYEKSPVERRIMAALDFMRPNRFATEPREVRP